MNLFIYVTFSVSGFLRLLSLGGQCRKNYLSLSLSLSMRDTPQLFPPPPPAQTAATFPNQGELLSQSMHTHLSPAIHPQITRRWQGIPITKNHHHRSADCHVIFFRAEKFRSLGSYESHRKGGGRERALEPITFS